ncbi:MAG: EAL domain-containing protein [Burkholderiales bacterium]
MDLAINSHLTLQNRVTLVNLVTTAAALLLATALLIGFEYLHLRRAFLEDLQVQSRILANNSSAALLFQDDKTAKEILSSMHAVKQVGHAEIIDLGGHSRADYSAPGFVRPATPLTYIAEEKFIFNKLSLEIFQPILVEGKPAGMLYICSSLKPLYTRLLVFAGAAILIVMGALAAAVLMLKGMRRTLSKAEQDLNYLAMFDPVTSLPNRNALNTRITQAVARAARLNTGLAVLFLDLDNFKIINDTLGHDAGDELLHDVALRLTNGLRGADSVFRLGGDEFTVLIEDMPESASAGVIAKNLINALQLPFNLKNHDVYVTTSIGISHYPEDSHHFKTLLKNADTAMYHAKSRGKNNFQFFSADMNSKAQKRLEVETSLRRALENNEFEVHYQPQVDQRTRGVVCMEALIRWRHPERGLVSPGEFIPVAEETGLIVPIGAWILKQACLQCRDWHKAGFSNLKMAVNLSGKQFNQENLTGQIAEILRETQLDPSYLELEITESAIMETSNHAVDILNQLRQMGLSLSIDDFGTGYSSMNYLKRFPISKLKIDRSFVMDIPGDKEDGAITEAIIALAKALNIAVVAEGVETVEQAEFLLKRQCYLVQGYFYSKPLPAYLASAFLAESSISMSTPRLAHAG